MLWTVAVVLFVLWILGFVVFHVAGGLIHLLLVLAIIAVVWSLVTGRRAGPTRLHPSIKGVRGARPNGASLVSFNLDAFTSHGWSQWVVCEGKQITIILYFSAIQQNL